MFPRRGEAPAHRLAVPAADPIPERDCRSPCLPNPVRRDPKKGAVRLLVIDHQVRIATAKVGRFGSPGALCVRKPALAPSPYATRGELTGSGGPTAALRRRTGSVSVHLVPPSDPARAPRPAAIPSLTDDTIFVSGGSYGLAGRTSRSHRDGAVDALELGRTGGEGLHQRRVELPGRLLNDDAHGLVMAEGRLVVTPTAQGVVDVGDRH